MQKRDLIYRDVLIAAYDAAHKGPPGGARKLMEEAPAVDAAPVVRCKDCKHRKLDGPSTCKSIVNEFYCDEKLGWRYQYEGEPDILDWFCADGERADDQTCGPDYCEIGGETDG